MFADLSIVIPTLNAAHTLSRTLGALPKECEIVIADGGSRDGTQGIAKVRGARVIVAPRGRGSQFAQGAARAKGAWLLFLHADTVLDPGWEKAVACFMAEPAAARRAAVFRFALDDASAAARRLEKLVALRTRFLGLPYGDQGLLISRAFYEALGGFRPLPLMADVDLVRRIGRRRLTLLDARALSSAERYRRAGYAARSARNLICLGLYFAGIPPSLIERLYYGARGA
jgi:rSAM/selenodomain-associated transferase 2